MKKILIISISIISILNLTSCSKKKANPSIFGEWKVTKSTGSYGYFINQTVNYKYDGDFCYDGSISTIHEIGTSSALYNEIGDAYDTTYTNVYSEKYNFKEDMSFTYNYSSSTYSIKREFLGTWSYLEKEDKNKDEKCKIKVVFNSCKNENINGTITTEYIEPRTYTIDKLKDGNIILMYSISDSEYNKYQGTVQSSYEKKTCTLTAI